MEEVIISLEKKLYFNPTPIIFANTIRGGGKIIFVLSCTPMEKGCSMIPVTILPFLTMKPWYGLLYSVARIRMRTNMDKY